MTMHLKKILSNLGYLDAVKAKRRTYHVYEGDGHYVLLSKGRTTASFNVSVVSEKTVDYLRRTFGGRRKLTTREVVNESKRRVHISDRFDALNALYVLCALGEAKIDQRYQEAQLYFNLKPA
jgi:hypothetical protein